MEGVRGNSVWTSPGTIVFGLKLTPDSREMLTWIVAKLTQPGDQVIGIHVLRSTDTEFLGEELDPTIKQQLDNTFEAVLAVYQGLCTLKQIRLDIKVVVGTNLREGLVEGARMEKATKVILGSNGRQTIRWTNSFASYCVKRMPNSCSILVIERGKVIFEKPGTFGSPGNSKESAGEVFRRSMRMFRGRSYKNSFAKTSINSAESNGSNYICKSTPPYNNDPPLYDSHESKASGFTSSVDNHSPNFSVSVVCSIADKEQYRACPNSDETTSSFVRRTQDRDVQIVEGRIMGKNVKHGLANLELLTKPGWPLMHRAIFIGKEKLSHSAARRLSVVTWALQLPDRPKLRLQSFLHNDDAISYAPHDALGKMLCNHSVTNVAHQEETVKERTAIHVAEIADSNVSIHDKEEKICESNEANVHNQGLLQLTHKLDSLCLNRSCSRYSYEELEEATVRFSSRNLVGRGGCSEVYQGVLQDGRRIAVKCLKASSLNAEDELLTEVEILSTLRHRNIVSLLGFCFDCQKRLLVYNLACEGNLNENLHGGDERPVLEWPTRYKIAVGVARGLEYLHDGCPRPVLHRDIKSSNILLTSEFEPQVSDFGIAKWAPASSSYITCDDVVGTFGYLAPEYFMFGKINEKIDVFSLGVVLLELISGKQPVYITESKGQENLVIWAKTLLKSGLVEELVDPRLKNNYNVKQMNRMTIAAALCIQQSPNSRPHMNQVVKFLSREDDNWGSLVKKNLPTIKFRKDECCSKDYLDDKGHFDLSSHLALSLLGWHDDDYYDDDVDDDAISQSSMDHSYIHLTTLNLNKTLEDYFNER